MTLQGHVHHGVIVLDTPALLPEGAAVQVQVIPTAKAPVAQPSVADLPLAERLKDFIGILDLPEDAALNHDHYLYGAPKKT